MIVHHLFGWLHFSESACQHKAFKFFFGDVTRVFHLVPKVRKLQQSVCFHTDPVNRGLIYCPVKIYRGSLIYN